MSFGRLRVTALDENASAGRRLRSLGHAIERYAWLTRTSFESIRGELDRRHGLRVRPPPAGAIADAFRELDAARTAFLAEMAAYAACRRLEKRAGRHRPRENVVRQLYRLPKLGIPVLSTGGRESSAAGLASVSP